VVGPSSLEPPNDTAAWLADIVGSAEAATAPAGAETRPGEGQ